MKFTSRNYARISSEEQGVALMTVLILTAVLMIIAGGMYVVASRESKMTQADFSGGQAFYYAEGGVENVLDILNYAATETQLTQPRADQSANGYGYLLDPNPSSRQNPTDPIEMRIGNDTYTVYLDTVDADGNHCTGCGLDLTSNDPAYLQITAQGQSGTGYRMLQQRAKVQASSYPLTFYINGDANLNGGPTISNESIFVRGSFYGREKLTVSGMDQIYGGAAGVRATGTIYAKSNGGRTQIYTSSGDHSSYWASNYINDRDSRGPSGNKFTITELESYFSTSGLTASQLASLRAMAKSSGYYNDNPSSNLMIQQGDLPSHSGDIVIYVDFPSGTPDNNEVNIKFEWPHSPYSSGKSLIIVKNGSLKLTGSAIGASSGVIYCPDGEVRSDGSGGGTFTGFVWGKGITNIGNFNFTLSPTFLDDPPFFAWTVYRETAWTEVDR
ncbi:MAG: pilus assembly PilX N-terminal domain-containing protein [Thermoleophilia bacterium]|jgi:hypothetical protein